MAAGLQVFDAAGELVLDVTDRMLAHHSSGEVDTPRGSGDPYFTAGAFVSVPGMSDDGTWMVITSGLSVELFGGVYYYRFLESCNEIRNGGFYVWVRPSYYANRALYTVLRC